MGRLKDDLLTRAERFSHRMVDVAEAVARQRRSARVIEQMIGAGTSVGANVWEASEALSRADFCKTLGVAMKELCESRFWLRLVAQRGWIRPNRVADLETEAAELLRVLGSIVHRTRTGQRKG